MWAIILAPYLYPGYLVMSGKSDQDPNIERFVFAALMYVLGLVLMMGADGQKYFTLREKKGLICDGFFKYTRNPNYLGEIMIYASFATMCGSMVVWAYFIFIWTVAFNMRMNIKDMSLAKKKGWEVYNERSYMLLPKIMSSDAVSFLTYTTVFAGVYFLWSAGGVRNLLNLYTGNY
jgi:protein-S-isoprenylcysteine O-methyltransferase Ste14